MARPSKYKAEYAEQARKLCLLGATNEDLADFFDVGITTLDRWISAHDEFRGALKSGKTIADATVADRLYKRATGYEHEAVKIFNNQGEIIQAPYIERYPPDTGAAIFWLKNRQRSKWRDKQDLEHTGANGGPIQHQDITDDQLQEKLKALGFGRESNQLAGKAVTSVESSDIRGSKKASS